MDSTSRSRAVSLTLVPPGPRVTRTPVPPAPSGFLTTTRTGLRRVAQVMGLPWMFDVCDPEVGEETLRAACEWLEWVDRTFSTYRTDSEISRLNRGELGRSDLHPDVRHVLDRCRALREDTRGYFDIAATYRNGSGPTAGHGRPGSVDPSGFVKGWAIAGVVEQLRAAGARNFAVNAGGDVHAAGHPDGDACWRIGIQHPRLAREVAMTIGLTDSAAATSGIYLRGEHITDPHTGRSPSGLLSVTIVGPDITLADAYATAVYAMGSSRAESFCANLDGYDAILIRDDDTVLTTPGVDSLRLA